MVEILDLQEVFELTQRKFLRHMMKSVSSQEAEPYPRLIVIDFITDKERQQEIQRQSSKKPTQVILYQTHC